MVMIGLSIGLLIIGYARNVSGSDVVDPRTILALSKAREALLGYATTYRDTHTGEGFGYNRTAAHMTRLHSGMLTT